MGRALKGYYVRVQADGALPNGSRARRVADPAGDLGTIIGSIRRLGRSGSTLEYFVEWDEQPGVAVLVTDALELGRP